MFFCSMYYTQAHLGGCLAATLNLANLKFSSHDVASAEGLYNRIVHRGVLHSIGDASFHIEYAEVASRAKTMLGMIYKDRGLRHDAREMFLDDHSLRCNLRSAIYYCCYFLILLLQLLLSLLLPLLLHRYYYSSCC